jgi:hypothetical protein
MKCVVLQPAYLPWRGYFHQIQKADLFVFYDDVQYVKRDWQNRNRVKTERGTAWLTVPVLGKGSQARGTPICEVAINPTERWAAKHLGTIEQSYRRAPYFDRYLPMVRSFYEDPPDLLADFTIDTTVILARELGLDTEFVRSSTLPASGTRTARLLSVLTHLGADHYVTGPSAAAYLEEERFTEAGITLEYMRYDYPEYPQLYPPFDPQVSIVDLLMMTGPEAGRYIWGEERS